ncbi:DMT family transporter [Haloimpatiens sp. FM7330]|uniref:DMT family transporter n=1 Tax=Haloimpatiens sp. FM7330 TaxID=3298610 RepID=UPI0036357422
MDNKPAAIIFMILSAFSFALMSLFVKIAGDIPMFERIFYTNVISLIGTFFIIRKKKKRLFGMKENQKYLFFRCLFGYLALVTNFYAINNLYLADSAMLNKLSPFFVSIFAYIFLKEKMTKLQNSLLIVVFIGAIFIIKPEFGFGMLPALSGVVSALFSGAAYTLLRFLGDKEDYSTILFYFSVISIIGSFPIMIMNYHKLTYGQIVLVIAMGLFWLGGQVFMTLAYKYAPAGEISIYNYSNIIFSAILGYFMWKEVPDLLSFIGGFLIILCGVINFIHSRKLIN